MRTLWVLHLSVETVNMARVRHLIIQLVLQGRKMSVLYKDLLRTAQ